MLHKTICITVGMDTEVLFVLKGEEEFDEERVVDLDKYVFLSFYVRYLLLLNNVMFAEYLHCISGTLHIYESNYVLHFKKCCDAVKQTY